MQISTVRVSAIRLGGTADDSSSNKDSEDEDSEEEFDDRVFVEVLAARTDQKKGKDKRGMAQQRFDPASRVWKEKSRKEGRLPAVKNLRPGKYVSPTVEEVVEVGEVHDDEMKDAPAASKSTGTKKLVATDGGSGKTTKSVKLADVIKEEADPEAMLDMLLNQPV